MNFNEVAKNLLLKLKTLDGKDSISLLAQYLKEAYDAGVADTQLPLWGEEFPTRAPDQVMVSMTPEEFEVVTKVLGGKDGV